MIFYKPYLFLLCHLSKESNKEIFKYIYFQQDGMENKEEEYKKPLAIYNKLVALISPSYMKHEELLADLKKGLKTLKKFRLNILEGRYAYEETHLKEKSYKRITSLIHEFFKDARIGAIFCRSGGGHSIEMIKYLNMDLIKKNPKIICGYSDDTSVLLHINDKAKMVVFHGPSAISFSHMNKFTEKFMYRVFFEKLYPLEIKLNSYKTWRKGFVTGKVLGGNLNVLTKYLKKYDLDFKDKILYMEDYIEKPEKIKFMLNKLKTKGVFDNIKGILIGTFTGAKKEELNQIRDHLLKLIKDKEIPVMYGFKSGHGEDKITLPFGTDVTLDSINKKVIYEECPLIFEENHMMRFIQANYKKIAIGNIATFIITSILLLNQAGFDKVTAFAIREISLNNIIGNQGIFFFSMSLIFVLNLLTAITLFILKNRYIKK